MYTIYTAVMIYPHPFLSRYLEKSEQSETILFELLTFSLLPPLITVDHFSSV